MNPHVFKRLEGLQTILRGVHQSSVGLSSATIGTERAAFIDEFLSKVLPPVYRFGTGDATDVAGHRSGQLDVVVEHPFSPSLPSVGAGPTRLYLAEGVAAVIEVKSNLANQWDQVLTSSAALAPLRKRFEATMSSGGPPATTIPYFAVGYTGWSKLETLQDHVAAAPHVTGALVIDPGLYVGAEVGAWGPHALWAFICHLHFLTVSLQSASSDPFAYTMP
jgi:hypothetical protein